jgi:hypothetical protein
MRHQTALTLLAFVAAGCTSNVTSPASRDAVSVRSDAGVSGGTGSAARSGEFQGTKDCTQFTADAGYYCEIESSNVPEIKVGSRFHYLDGPAVFTPAGSTVILDSRDSGNNTANGHCAMDLNTLTGLCTFSGGTGRFKNFNARFAVGTPSGVTWHLNGPYSF